MIKLVRLDYRLLHGQVVFSWTGHVGAQRIIVVDDDAANDEMKKSALLLSKRYAPNTPSARQWKIHSRWACERATGKDGSPTPIRHSVKWLGSASRN